MTTWHYQEGTGKYPERILVEILVFESKRGQNGGKGAERG
jgi:hypothetical protein